MSYVVNERSTYRLFASLASTYRPPDLGSAEIDMLRHFAQGTSQSTYDILKKKHDELIGFRGKRKPSYKDVHKRVQRLAELKLIEPVSGVFERGAMHYRITHYGLITSLEKSTAPNFNHIVCNIDNVVIRVLLSDFFELETIETFKHLKEFPGRILEEYLHDCCSRTTDICRRFWTSIGKTKVIEILPSDDIIEKYMLHLTGEPVEEHVMDEIHEYEKRLKQKVENDESLAKAVEQYDDNEYLDLVGGPNPFYPGHAPFPFLDIYYSIVILAGILKKKRSFLVFSLVTELGKRVKAKEALQKDFSLDSILNDKRFYKLVTELKEVFDKGNFVRSLIDL